MHTKYSSLHNLMASEADAKSYFDGLPGYIREQIETRADNVNTFEALKDYAENLLRGDD